MRVVEYSSGLAEDAGRYLIARAMAHEVIVRSIERQVLEGKQSEREIIACIFGLIARLQKNTANFG